MAGELGAGPELDGADITDSEVIDNDELGDLFEDESVSESELRGDDTTAEETADAGPTGDEPEETEETKPEEENPEEEKPEGEEEEKPKEEPEEEPEPHPAEKKAEGLQVALHQEREQSRDLKSQIQQANAYIAQLNETITSLKAPKSDDKWKDFKVLTEEEYVELDKEDPAKAARYMFRLHEYEKHQSAEREKQAAVQQRESAYKGLVYQGVQELEGLFPGIYKDGNEDSQKVLEYADKHMPSKLVDLITDPGIKLTDSSGKQYVLGRGAAQIAKFIKSAYEADQNKPDMDSLREEIKAELLPELTERAQREVMEKFKNDPQGAFRSLDQASSSSSKEVKPVSGFVSEEELARMPADEEAKLLGA